jgi:uncharacterized membrane-anchored protein YhcB (DUF1043 family)
VGWEPRSFPKVDLFWPGLPGRPGRRGVAVARCRHAGPKESAGRTLAAYRSTMSPSSPGWTADEWAALGSVTQAIATILALAVAVVAARFAARQVREARAQVEEARKTREAHAEQARLESEEQAQREQRLREEQARPFVVVDFEPSPVWGNIINLEVENVGKTLAKNVHFSFSPPLKSSLGSRNGHDFEHSALLTGGIPAMPPGKRFVALFDLSHERLEAGLPMSYTVRVDLQDFQGRQQEPLEYVLDLNFRYGMERVEAKTVHHVAELLKKIERNVERWTQHSNGLRVWVRDEQAYLARQRELYEERRAQQDRATPTDSDDDTDNSP